MPSSRSVLQRSASTTLIANENLLKEVRKLAIRGELFAMRLRGMLVVTPVVQKPVAKPDANPDAKA